MNISPTTIESPMVPDNLVLSSIWFRVLIFEFLTLSLKNQQSIILDIDEMSTLVLTFLFMFLMQDSHVSVSDVGHTFLFMFLM